MNNRNTQYNASPENTKAVLSFFFAILGLMFCFVPILSMVLIAISAVLGIMAYRGGNRGGAVAGIAISIVALIIALIVWGSTGSLTCAKKDTGSDIIHDFSDNYVGDSADVSGGDFSGTDWVSDTDGEDFSDFAE